MGSNRFLVDDFQTNVLDYSADPSGQSLSGPMFAAAVADTPVGGTLYIPKGFYRGPFVADKFLRIKGDGPERTILAPSGAGATGAILSSDFATSQPSFEVSDLSFDGTSAPTCDGFYANNGTYARFHNLKFRKCRRGLWFGNFDGTIAQQIVGLNCTDALVYVDDGGALLEPNVQLKDIYYTNSQAVATAAGIWVNCFTSGVAMENVQIIPNVAVGSVAAGIRLDSPSVPSGVFGHFGQLSNVVTDGISGPGILANNCRQLQIVNSFLGTKSAANGGTGAGLKITGACRDFDLVGNWISGLGIELTASTTLAGFQWDDNIFPQTVAGGALLVPAGATLSDWQPGRNRYSTAMTPDAATLARILAACGNAYQLKTKAGAFSDSDFSPAPPGSSIVGIDTTNNRLYVKYADGTYHFATLT